MLAIAIIMTVVLAIFLGLFIWMFTESSSYGLGLRDWLIFILVILSLAFIVTGTWLLYAHIA